MYHIIVNPASRSGRGLKYWNIIEPVLKEKNIAFQVYFSKAVGHTTVLVQEITSAVKQSSTEIHLIILGGDGTVNEAIQGIERFENVSFSYIPTGSSNDLARDLKIPRDPLTALDEILNVTHSRILDIGRLHYERAYQNGEKAIISDRYFSVSSGIGFDAAVCEEALSSKIKDVLNKCGLGKLTYLGIAVKQLLTAKYISGTLSLDDAPPIPLDRLFFVASMIHQYEGGGFCFCPTADDSDGYLDLCVVTSMPKLKMLFVLPTAFKGKHYRFHGIDSYRAKKITIQTSSPLWVHTDGEVKAKADLIHLSCVPNMLHFIY